jgi:hypothetical protein
MVVKIPSRGPAPLSESGKRSNPPAVLRQIRAGLRQAQWLAGSSLGSEALCGGSFLFSKEKKKRGGGIHHTLAP